MWRTQFLSLLSLIYIPVLLTAQSLSVSENHRFLITDQGKPFLWLGDTAWELFHRLDREEADRYLSKRAEQGFSVIQAVVLAENDGLKTPNPYGQVPFVDLSPEQPNEAYFAHVDYIVQKANELDLIVGMLPTWGDKVFSVNPGTGPIVFNVKNAEKYGEFLGRRYRNSKIIWILGGDRNIANEEVLEIWGAMARGLKKGDGGHHLITYHPRGATSSSYWLHNESWLDFNMYQSGHGSFFLSVYNYAETDYLLQPTKPCVEGEPAYEDIPVEFWKYCDWSNPQRVPDEVLDENNLIKDHNHFSKGFFTDYDVRVHAYWNFLSGACGYTYGNNAVWQMFKKGGPIAIPCLTDWEEALDRPGANDIRHLKTIFEAYPFSKLIPDQSIVYGPNPKGENHIRAAIANDQSFALVYLAKGQAVAIQMKKLEQTITASWFDPREGKMLPIGAFETKGIKTFEPPSSGKQNDWLLILNTE